MNEDEQREALMRFAKSIGDAASGAALAFVAIATAVRECAEAFEHFAVAAEKQTSDDTDRA